MLLEQIEFSEYSKRSRGHCMEMSKIRHQVLAQQWRLRITEQQASGLSVRRWCAEQKIVESKYYYWLQILRSEELTISQPTELFAQLQVTRPTEIKAAAPSARVCGVIRNHDLSLEIYNGADPQTLAATLRALGFLSK